MEKSWHQKQVPCCMLGLALSLKVVGECFPLFCWGYSTVTQGEIFPLGRSLQEMLGVVPVMAQEIFCVSMLLYWICASMCPTGCQMVGALGVESLVLASQTGEAAWAPAGRNWSPGARALPCRSCGAAVSQMTSCSCHSQLLTSGPVSGC